MTRPDYSYKNLLQMAEKGREEKRQKEEEMWLNYTPPFWDELEAAAKDGASSFLITILPHQLEIIRAFLERNGYEFSLGPAVNPDYHHLTIPLIPKKEEEKKAEEFLPYDVIIENLKPLCEIQFKDLDGEIWNGSVIYVEGNEYFLDRGSLLYQDNSWLLINGKARTYIQFINKDDYRLYAVLTGFRA